MSQRGQDALARELARLVVKYGAVEIMTLLDTLQTKDALEKFYKLMADAPQPRRAAAPAKRVKPNYESLQQLLDSLAAEHPRAGAILRSIVNPPSDTAIPIAALRELASLIGIKHIQVQDRRGQTRQILQYLRDLGPDARTHAFEIIEESSGKRDSEYEGWARTIMGSVSAPTLHGIEESSRPE